MPARPSPTRVQAAPTGRFARRERASLHIENAGRGRMSGIIAVILHRKSA